jgi:C1A family cysteine protease
MQTIPITRLMVITLLIITSCKKEKTNPVIDPRNPQNPPVTVFGTGWNSKENFSQTIPVAINYGNYQSQGNLPVSVDLTSRFPPVGYQGQLGTCVAWAVGYNNKSYLDGVADNLSSAQLFSPDHQYSPEDLFFSIEPSRRDCKTGTFFDDAFNVLINRGVNTLATVPYDGLCHGSSPGSPSSASANRIKNFRRLEGSVTEIKEYLAQGLPVVMGAMVNGAFQAWRGSGVLDHLNHTGDEGGHAMIIAGYDDARGAFRIINSWGSGWGDNGYAWVGYDFLVNQFCVQGGQKSLFVAFNDNTTTIDPPAPTGGPDITSLVMADFTLYPAVSLYSNARRAFFDVKNIGEGTMKATDNWNIYYLWVDAFNANNYGIIFRGEFTTDIPQNTYQNITSNYTRINFDLAPGHSLGETIAGLSYISWDYFMPLLTGNYYLVLFIDKGRSNETNQTNNVFYVTQAPKYFTNGYNVRTDEREGFENKYHFENLSTFRHELNKRDLLDPNIIKGYRRLYSKTFSNAYTSEEIISFLMFKIHNGGL